MTPERAFFLHLMRTGGTALKGRLRRAVGDDAFYPPVQELKVDVTKVDRLTEQYATRRDQLRVVAGHFPLCVVDLLGDPFSTFTILRDPVERSLSHLRRRSLGRPERYEGHGLAEIYDDPWVQVVVCNHMVKMLSLTVDEMSDDPVIQRVTLNDDRLRRAKHNLEQMDVVGVQDEAEDFCAALEARFGWDLGPPLFANQTDPIRVPRSLRKRLVEDNQLDIELFQHARDLLAATRPARSPAVAPSPPATVEPDAKIVVTRRGRSGATLLVELLDRLGLDAGARERWRTRLTTALMAVYRYSVARVRGWINPRAQQAKQRALGRTARRCDAELAESERAVGRMPKIRTPRRPNADDPVAPS